MSPPLTRYRVAIGWAAALAVLYLATPTPRTLTAGVLPALAGLLLRGVAAGTIRKGEELACSGPYAFTRNPLYLGSSLLTLGFAIMSGSLPAAGLLVGISAVVYPRIIRNEERELEAQYGDRFLAFRRRVPRFLPRTIGPGMAETFSFRLFLENGEYNATLGFLGAAGLLAAKWWLFPS
jgi:protein-S-isoprenylcysteine O-methyltransferase Ste14